MKKLFIDKTIEIKAPASRIWSVLTLPEYTGQWTSEFSPDMKLEANWELGGAVLWKEADGKVVVEGNVTKIDPEKLLRFTVFDVEMGRTPVTEEDGITFELVERADKTTLHILHGDFATISEGQKYYEMSIEPWNNILPKIKELAEK